MADRVYRGEIYYIHETEGTGSEQTGGRPGIIISNDIGNRVSYNPGKENIADTC